jgi:hypothetical protein
MDREQLLLSPLAYMPPTRVLDGLSAEDTCRRIPGVSHSILDIVAHLVFWQNWFLDRCSGIAVPLAPHAAEGWPATSAADWEPLREQFLAGVRRAVLASRGTSRSAN